MIRNGKITVAMLSYCLTTTLKGMDVSVLPIIRVTTVFLYILLIVENNRGGSAYLDGIVIRSFWFEMSNDFTKYANTNQLGKVWLCLRCAKIFIVNITYWHPTPGVEPNWYLTPCAFMIFNAHPHRMLLNILSPMSIRVMLRNLLGSDRSPRFGTSTIWPLCNSW